ncbi:MarR family winged helix-turn-helix transcriptional regulator [Curtobacterium sp. L1-20]|uniref:MarR family winged helix-turn-helix transcriptional regulator n=1 Tax=Curtobacterium sp. L1-20 TaxID=3138181 RepID=UPI003B525731
MEQKDDRVAIIQAEWRRERPDLDIAPQGVIGRLHRLAAHLTDEIVAVYAEHGLREGEFDVLATLRRAGAPFERHAGELAESTMVTTGGMTKRLDRLEKAGLVVRRRSDTDARGRVVRLTPRGVGVIDDAVTAHLANERRLLDLVPAHDHDALEKTLRSWLEHFEAPR